MKLKNSILLALVGISYIFISRTLGTFFPEIFMNVSVSRGNVVISLLAVLSYLLFFYKIYQDYALPGGVPAKQESGRLRNAVISGMISVLLVLPIFIKGIFTVFDLQPWKLLNPQPALEITLLLASAIAGLYFTIIFYDESMGKIGRSFTAAAKLAIVGSSFNLLIRVYLFFNYYYSSQFRWTGELSQDMPYIIIPILIFIFYTTIHFLIAFYRDQGQTERD